MRSLIDANVILRYMLNDHQEMAEKAKIAIRSGVFTTPEVLAEVVYVLQGVYKVPREVAAKSLLALLTEVHVEHKNVCIEALTIYADKRLDFVDCILIARNHILGENIITFDKKLSKNLI